MSDRRVVAIADAFGRVELVDLERAIVVSAAKGMPEALSMMSKRYSDMLNSGAYELLPRTPERYLEIAEWAYLRPNDCGPITVYRSAGGLYWRQVARGGAEVLLAAETEDFM